MIELNKATTFLSDNTYVCKSDCLDYFNADAKATGGIEFPLIKTAILLQNLENVVLDFNGATLRIHGEIQPFTLIDCKNVTIKNVVVENERSHYTEGVIMPSLPFRYRIRLNEKFPFNVADNNLIVYGDGWKNENIYKHPMMFMQFFKKDTRQATGYMPLINVGKTAPEYDKKHFYVHHVKAFKKGQDLILRGGIWMKPQKAGTHVVLEHENRKTGTLLALRCDDLTLQNFRILNGSGMGIMPICCKNVTLDRLLFCYDQKSHGYVTNAADGLHSFACSGTMTLKNCIFEGMIDDALNVHGNYFLVQSAKKDSLFARCASLAFEDKGADETTRYFPLRIGDTISINRAKTLDKRDEYKILNVIHHENGLAELLLDRTPVCEVGDLIEDVSAQVDLNIKNCVFGKANTHLRFQTRGNVIIEDCVTELPFFLTGDTTYWFEGSPCVDFTVKNCRFVGKYAKINVCPEITPTKDLPYYHKNITIDNCVFDTQFALQIRLADNVVFSNNKISGGKKAIITATKCGKINCDNAKLIRT